PWPLQTPGKQAQRHDPAKLEVHLSAQSVSCSASCEQDRIDDERNRPMPGVVPRPAMPEPLAHLWRSE
ncbi:MAG: hypothetical protein OXU20_10975, partial [Myxococcales bacterium]|nr:hypothetical protein [Myxococcales bacterium]MDD9967107.1 hypothetical protein [Myxococcales bacterium]